MRRISPSSMSRLLVLIIPLVILGILSGCCTIPGQGPPCPDLSGTWLLVSYHGGDSSMIPVPPEARITAVFGDDFRVSGNAGCNDYFGSYRIEGGLISIGSLGSTEKYCLWPEGVMEREGLYLGLLRKSTRYNVDGDDLTLSYYDEQQLLLFRRE